MVNDVLKPITESIIDYESLADVTKYVDFKLDKETKEKILNFLSSQPLYSVATYVPNDIFSNKPLPYNELKVYKYQDFYWDIREIYYFKNYDLKLSNKFINNIK